MSNLGSNTAAHFFDTSFTTNGPLYSAASGVVTSGAAGSAGQIYQSAGAGSPPAYSTATFPSTATGTGTILRADGTNWVATTSTYPNTNAVSTLLYASSANVMAALATANSGVLTTDSSGVPSIDTTNFVRQTTGMQMKGNNTNTAPPSGFIGEQLTSNAASVSLSNNTSKTIASINVTAGVWMIIASCHIANTGAWTQVDAGISTTTNTLPAGNAGINFANLVPGATQSLGGNTLAPPTIFALLSGTTTYYIVARSVFSGGTASGNAIITAVRIG